MACLVRDFSEFKVFMLPVRSSFYAASSIRCMIKLWTGPAVCTVFGCSWHLLKLHCGWNSIQSMIKLYRHNINNKQAAQMTNVQITQYHFAHYVKTPSCILHYGQCCGPIVSNYNRANDVAGEWQPTPKTADVTVTKIAGYVRVCILTNRWFFSYFWHS